MKIAIDISAVVYETGVSTYTKNLIKHLLKVDKNNEYILFGGSLRRKHELSAFVDDLKGNFTTKLFSIPPTLADLMWNRLHSINIENLVGKIDIFHSSDWAQPPSNAHKVTTIHDLVPLKYPNLSHPKIVAVHTRRFKHIKNEANVVIVPSKNTKKDLIDLKIPKKRIKVIYEAPDSIYKPAGRENIQKLKNKYRIKGKYLLAVGITPRKNVERIIDAFEKVKAGMNIRLVVIGEPKVKLDHRRGVIYTGHVEANDMPTFYSGAEALVYPSLYEGFGLPILDSFACKTPVVTSNTGSMKEIAGKAAVLVDPYKVDSITNGIITALEDNKNLVTMGSKMLKNYSWDKTAQETLNVYEGFGRKK
jgi:glycosyltransferase involved in cell wall biosynthesis